MYKLLYICSRYRWREEYTFYLLLGIVGELKKEILYKIKL
jgi:hypothetical protein